MFLQQIIFSFSVGTWVKFISDKMAQHFNIDATSKSLGHKLLTHLDERGTYSHIFIGYWAHNGSRVGTKLISNQFRAGIGISRILGPFSDEGTYKASIHDIRLMSLQICVKSKHGCSSGMMTRSQDLVNLRACNARSSFHEIAQFGSIEQFYQK